MTKNTFYIDMDRNGTATLEPGTTASASAFNTSTPETIVTAEADRDVRKTVGQIMKVYSKTIEDLADR
jgi:hypothetical protein